MGAENDVAHLYMHGHVMGTGRHVALLQGRVALEAALSALEAAQGAARHPWLGALLVRLLRAWGRARDEAHQIVLQCSWGAPGVLQALGGPPRAPVLGSGVAVLQGAARAAVQMLLRWQLLLAHPGRLPLLVLLLLLLLLLCAAGATVKGAPCITNTTPSPLARQNIGMQYASRRRVICAAKSRPAHHAG